MERIRYGRYTNEQYELMRGLHIDTDRNASEAARIFFETTGVKIDRSTIINHWRNRWDLEPGQRGGRRESLEESVFGATPRDEEDEIIRISEEYGHVVAEVAKDPRIEKVYSTVERILRRRGITPVKGTYRPRKSN